MVTQAYHERPCSPRTASRRQDELDDLLRPELFKALADPTRLRLLTCLIKCGRACSVSELAACCSVDFSVVARHLALLARAELVAGEKRGRVVWYTPLTAELGRQLRAMAEELDVWPAR